MKAATGLGSTTIYKLMAAGDFPASYQLAARAIGWHSGEVAAWIDSRTPTPWLQTDPKTATAAKPAVSGIGSLSAAPPRPGAK
ncbi:helix-turn-helix transcriptional regulator [Candidatus Poriferisodalis sp.]|uniref:helix-turn-helix transcriptional regulator n=1 Tax=Candidatus Poriferisodalis sp. TaxID=3101277 RepID=UPI003B02E84F